MSLASYQAAPPRVEDRILKQKTGTCKQNGNLYNIPAMAHKKAGGSTQNGRDSVAKRRGVKRFGGQQVNAGEILIRQKGFWYVPGKNTHVGSDWTIHADVTGVVKFSKMRRARFDGSRQRCTVVSVEAAKA